MVHTYGWYLRKFVNETKEKGGIPIICSLVPRNNWENGKEWEYEIIAWLPEDELPQPDFLESLRDII